jgi:large subunit ribosomal protein L24
VEGLNLFTRHQRATDTENRGGRLQKEGSIHVSNVMYYAEKIKRPVRVKHTTLQDGRKVRGYINPETKEFEQIDV